MSPQTIIASINQFTAADIASLKAKLAQYPSGTEFRNQEHNSDDFAGHDERGTGKSLRLLVEEKSHRWRILLSVSSRYNFSDTLRHSEVL